MEVIDQFDEVDKVEDTLLQDTLRWDRGASLTENRVVDITPDIPHIFSDFQDL